MPLLTPTHVMHWCKSGGRPSAARLSRWQAMADRIIRLSDEWQTSSDADLLARSREIRWQAKSGVPLDRLLIDAYALVRETARRTLGMAHFPVQLMGGIALFEGNIAEMQTGEGKTLTATAPAFLRALPGHGCHVITVNDYLAGRDADHMGTIYKALGLTVGCVQTDMEPDARRAAYRCDIAYGTAKEMGFDFLRDRLRLGVAGGGDLRYRPFETRLEGEPPVQRGHYFALIDEADSILVDEARTPLIIGLTQPNDAATVSLARWCRHVAVQLAPETDFVYQAEHRAAYLTDRGCRKIILRAKPSLLDTIDTDRLYTSVELALNARMGFHRDRDYIVVEDEVVIVDESTGRVMDGRKWQDGLHQAIEAKEGLPITAATGQAARITVQAYFRNYTHLAGMTGTALPVRRELRRTYHLRVTAIPTHRPCIRRALSPRIFATLDAKRHAVAAEIERLTQSQRSVLVGTPSVDASEALGVLLTERGVAHQILNARHHEQEAEIVARAGESGKVTIATNMAGRGTDILLKDSVRAAGGLHVIATEMHSAARIDRQLVGRAARQGDPGSFQFFLSLEDELLRCYTPERRLALQQRARPDAAGELPAGWRRLFKSAQRLLEKSHARQRKDLLRAENHRTKTYITMGLDPYLELTE